MKNELSSRERVRKVLNGEEPDRIPIDFGGTKVTGINVDEYLELGRYTGVDLEYPKVYEQFQMLARVDNELIRKWLHTDIIELENEVETFGFKNCDWIPWQTSKGNSVLMPGGFKPVVDEKGYTLIKDNVGNTIACKAPDSLYFDRICKTTEISMEIVKMDPKEWKNSIPLYKDEELKELEKKAKLMHENTEYSIHGGFVKGSLGSTGIFAGHTIGEWLIILITEKEYAYEIIMATAERAIENLKLYLDAVGRYIDTILVSEYDYGTQKGEFFNPEIFKELYMPNYKLINDYVHKKSKAKVMFHSCGSIRKIIGYMIEAGVDILNPVQTSAADMVPYDLKKEFGKKIVFWGGGANTQKVLPFGTEEEVREHVKKRINTFGKGGGFVFAADHNLQYGIPIKNVDAMIRTIVKYGNYFKQY